MIPPLNTTLHPAEPRLGHHLDGDAAGHDAQQDPLTFSVKSINTRTKEKI